MKRNAQNTFFFSKYFFLKVFSYFCPLHSLLSLDENFLNISVGRSKKGKEWEETKRERERDCVCVYVCVC